ncbi:MAG: hypothetical protein HQ591_12610 [candidate division Zixibacteria bacterium]|nr:hypothetical protein [Candidatus Tariuqbacter arcticus]
MIKISKKYALELLENSRHKIEDEKEIEDRIMNIIISNPKFIKWKTITESRIRIIFGTESENYKEFKGIPFDSVVDIKGGIHSDKARSKHWRHCHKASALLAATKEEVGSWPDDEVNVEEVNSKPVRQFEARIDNLGQGFSTMSHFKLFVSMKLNFDGRNVAHNEINKYTDKYGLDPDKDIMIVKTASRPVTQEVIDTIMKCRYMLQIYDSDEDNEHFTWLFFEYAIARTLEKKIVRVVEKRFLNIVTVDRDIPLITFNRSSRENEPIEKAIKEAFEQLFETKD